VDELIADFLAEASEGLESLDNKLVELEKNPEDADLIGSIFRVMHTIKGTCGFLGLDKLASVAHAGENIIDKVRNKELKIDKNNISIVLEAIDVIKSIVEQISETGSEPDKDYSDIIKKINDAANSAPIKEKSKVKKVKKVEKKVASSSAKEASIKEDVEDSVVTKKSEDSNDNKVSYNAVQTIRVNVDVLEKLMQIVSELVLSRNQLIQLTRNSQNSEFTIPVQQLNMITSSLQEKIMETRMQPISSAWTKIPRMVRDLANDLNKKIELVMLGKETELDRQLIESIKDPLVHMIRNSADHGLETPDERISAGKPEEGVITLEAYHQGGHIIIKVSDDGRGVNVKKVKDKILQNKLATELELDAMPDVQIMQYIFSAGLSTADKVTGVSGRGVGMDVVKNNIEKIRGMVVMDSTEGKGSVFTIKIPLTLAIMPILIIESSKHKFGIPQINIIEMVRADSVSENLIEEINERKVLRLRGSLLPLIDLSEVLGIANEEQSNNVIHPIVICEANGNQFGIIIDKIQGMEEIVLKPVSKLIESISIYSGNTLLGDGSIIMILDPSGLAKYLKIKDHHSATKITSLADQIHTNKKSSFLTFKSGMSYNAIPLELISRLEEIDASKIEMSAGKPVIQYRGSLMFLTFLPGYKLPKKGIHQVLVFTHNQHILGLMVEKIIDIIEQDIESSLSFEENDLNALVLGGKTVDLVDITQFFHEIFFEDVKIDDIESLSTKDKKAKVLMLDDSPFFRKAFPKILEKYGLEAICAKTANEAIDMLGKADSEFGLIITDINMPDVDGFEFAKICTSDPRFKHIPVIALTSNLDLVSDKEKTKSSGIRACVSKTSYDELIPLIYSLLKIE
jgi:two-component system, chemotaxis family, sensor kinase CheA